ncbi:MAG: segregation/condensation protein A [Hungatella sp.]|nr:segregation/condensation protein A [Hungatella sp.]
MAGISYKLDNFEGPLDLLLHLIEKNKVSIYDIPIVLITQQYLDYVSHMETEDLNVVSEFLVMAATLIDIKSKMLLPAQVNEEGEEEDPRAELVARLLEYKMYKCMAQELLTLEEGAARHLFKVSTVPREVAEYQPPVDLDELLGDLNLAKLQAVFESVIKRRADKIDPIRSRFGTIRREPVSLENRIKSVMDYARSHRKFSFRHLLERQGDKLAVVVTFLAVLELMKMGKIHLTQENLFEDMNIETLEPEGESGELDLEGLDDFEG